MRRLLSSASVTARRDLFDALHGDMKFELRRNRLIECILRDSSSGITTKRYTNHDIIVSLTSYGRRVHEVSLTIESLMQQTMKANRIVLWLPDDMRESPLPQALIMQQRRGLEIKYCKDIRSYKKLIPQLKISSDDAIITADDDIFYDYDVLEHLIAAFLEQPNVIHCSRVRKMSLDKKGSLIPYNQWAFGEKTTGMNRCFFLTGVGGVLYPPHCFDDEVFNDSVFLDLCPEADDVWFTAMALKKGTPINKVFTRDKYGEDYIMIPHPLESGLVIRNVGQHGNDRQIKAVFSKYALYDLLK